MTWMGTARLTTPPTLAHTPSLFPSRLAAWAARPSAAGGYELANDLGFRSGGSWLAPIGYYNSDKDYAYYNADFDGNGRTISNYRVNVGLFGVWSERTVKCVGLGWRASTEVAASLG